MFQSLVLPENWDVQAGAVAPLVAWTSFGIEMTARCPTAFALTNGFVLVSIARARRSGLVSNIAMATRGTASTTATLARMGFGLWTPETRTYTPLAETANDTTMFQSTFTGYQRAFSTGRGLAGSVYVQRGLWYASSVIAVGQTVTGVLYAATIRSSPAGEMLGGSSAGSQADLPTTPFSPVWGTSLQGIIQAAVGS
jgi:hypothetical protein